jgi:hypothetical protein
LNADNLFLPQLVILISGYQIRQLLAITSTSCWLSNPPAAGYQILK